MIDKTKETVQQYAIRSAYGFVKEDQKDECRCDVFTICAWCSLLTLLQNAYPNFGLMGEDNNVPD